MYKYILESLFAYLAMRARGLAQCFSCREHVYTSLGNATSEDLGSGTGKLK